MANLGQTFDANTIEPADSFEVLPAGWYKAQITESEMRSTKSGGQYLSLHWRILDGQYVGRFVFDRLNLINDNQTAVEIAQKALSAICRAVNVMQVRDSIQLHNKPIEIKIGIEKPREGYEPRNNVKGYRAISSGQVATSFQAPPAAAQNVQAPPTASQPGGNQPSWATK